MSEKTGGVYVSNNMIAVIGIIILISIIASIAYFVFGGSKDMGAAQQAGDKIAAGVAGDSNSVSESDEVAEFDTDALNEVDASSAPPMPPVIP